jgi:osmotically-inducible protein OsmY
MADDRWNHRNDRSYDRDFANRDSFNRDDRYRYAGDRDRDFGRNRERYDRDVNREIRGDYGQGGYDTGDYGYGRQVGGYSGTQPEGREGLAGPGAFTEFGTPSSSGYASQYGSPTSPPATAWLGSSRDQGRGYGYGRDTGYGYRGVARAAEPRSFGQGNSYLDDIADGGEGRGQRLGEHRGEHHGEHRGRGPRNYKRSDERIHDDVNDRLTDDAWLDAQDIEVKVKDREVTLTGKVRDRAAKRRAEILAEQVSGVDNVQNNLRVDRGDKAAEAGATELGAGATGPA